MCIRFLFNKQFKPAKSNINIGCKWNLSYLARLSICLRRGRLSWPSIFHKTICTQQRILKTTASQNLFLNFDLVFQKKPFMFLATRSWAFYTLGNALPIVTLQSCEQINSCYAHGSFASCCDFYSVLMELHIGTISECSLHFYHFLWYTKLLIPD